MSLWMSLGYVSVDRHFLDVSLQPTLGGEVTVPSRSTNNRTRSKFMSMVTKALFGTVTTSIPGRSDLMIPVASEECLPMRWGHWLFESDCSVSPSAVAPGAALDIVLKETRKKANIWENFIAALSQYVKSMSYESYLKENPSNSNYSTVQCTHKGPSLLHTSHFTLHSTLYFVRGYSLHSVWRQNTKYRNMSFDIWYPSSFFKKLICK